MHATEGWRIVPEQRQFGIKNRERHHAGATDVSQTYHSAVGHGALGFAGALGALPPLWLSVRRLADLEDIPGGSGAVFAPIRCRTHAYTSTNKTALTRNGSLPCTPPRNSATFPRFLPRRPAPVPLFAVFSLASPPHPPPTPPPPTPPLPPPPPPQFTLKFTFANCWQA